MGQGERVCVVSGCSSIDEFVAAFRNHARRDDVFVPTSTPLPVGARGHVAITLRDNRVVIEGEARVVSVARSGGLHGMTLRFVGLGAAARDVLDRLDRARFSARTPRVSAALAECLVVGALPAPGAARSPEPAELPFAVELLDELAAGNGTDTVQMWTTIPAIPMPIVAALPTEKMSELAPPVEFPLGTGPMAERAEVAALEAARDDRHARTSVLPWWSVALIVIAMTIVAILIYVAM